MDPESVPEHPNLPRRGVLGLMFAAIVLAGSLGGLIGYGLVATTCSEAPTRVERMLEQVPEFQPDTPACGLKELGAALGGTIVAAIGAGIVAALVGRSQSEWRGHAP